MRSAAESFRAGGGDASGFGFGYGWTGRGGFTAPVGGAGEGLRISARVHWTGMLEGDLKWGAFHAADAFVLPSHQENFGIAVVEALACGVPVLISEKANIWPDIDQDKAGIVNPDTAEGTYQSMTSLLGMQPEERRGMISRGLECFRTRYEMKRTAQALNELL